MLLSVLKPLTCILYWNLFSRKLLDNSPTKLSVRVSLFFPPKSNVALGNSIQPFLLFSKEFEDIYDTFLEDCNEGSWCTALLEFPGSDITDLTSILRISSREFLSKWRIASSKLSEQIVASYKDATDSFPFTSLFLTLLCFLFLNKLE